MLQTLRGYSGRGTSGERLSQRSLDPDNMDYYIGEKSDRVVGRSRILPVRIR